VRSAAGWRWLYDNPARLEAKAAAGWVTDGPDGQPAAHVGNLVQRFWLGDQVLYGATGFSVIVAPGARGASRVLLEAFSHQPGMFATWVFNANRRSQPLYHRHGMVAWPEQTHALKLSWILSPLPLLAGRALRAAYRIAPHTIAALDEPLLNARLWETPRITFPIGVSLLTELTDDSPFARFWKTLQNEGRLLADRSPAMLRWRLTDPDITIPPLLLAHRRDGAVTGYAMAQMAKANSLEPPVLEIIDLEALADDSEAIPTLMDGLKLAARAMGAAKLRLQTMTPLGLSRLGRHANVTRREGGWGHCHVRFAQGAPDPALWSPTPYDGDYAACLRPLPLQDRSVASRSRVFATVTARA
jgi:hypothetical protein